MIQIEHLSVAYQQTLALENLSLTIQGPTILGILGPNGAGKSTLIKAMLGLLPHSGKVLLDQKDLDQVLQRVAYVEQKTAIDFHFPITVRECVSLGLYPHLSIFKRKSKEDLQKVEDALKLVNLLDLADAVRGADKGGRDKIKALLDAEHDILFVLVGQRRKLDLDVGHVHAFLLAQLAAVGHLADDVRSLHFHHVQLDQAVVDQDLVARGNVLVQSAVIDMPDVVVAHHLAGGQGEGLAVLQRNLLTVL